MIDYQALHEAMSSHKRLRSWAVRFEQQISNRLSPARHGEIPDWIAALQALPSAAPSVLDLKSSVTIGAQEDLSTIQHHQLRNALESLIPWRKGPFRLFGLGIDAEWRSDWKWQRLLPHIAPLANRLVLDVGCGNGYHCLRMLGENAQRVVGVDPSARFIIQFQMLKKYLGSAPVDVLPLTLEDVPPSLEAFDTSFSMGVLYHRRSPIDHLQQMRATLRPGGELVLETLIVEGRQGYCLVPEGRYAQMNNVWFIPSVDTLLLWLRKCGFRNARCVDTNTTSIEEQRPTDWMTGHSLANFLDANNHAYTIEGHPAPCRGIFIAERAA